MAESIEVYNLEDNGTPTESVASQPSASSGVVASTTATSGAPSGSPASPITEGDVRVIIRQELAGYTGDVRIGSMLSGEVFILDGSGMRLGGTNFSTAPFSVDYDGNLVTTNGYVLGNLRVGSGTPHILIDGANAVIKSSDYASETTGWQISKNGDAEFNNLRSRGRISTSVFVKEEVSAVGGRLVIANADVLASAMTALDSATLTIKADSSFAVNDILHIKDGTDEEYLRVTNIASAPTYSVTRDLAGAYSSNNNPPWGAGTAIVVEGSSDGASTFSGGYLRLLGSGTNAPRYGVFKRTGVLYSDIVEYVGIGNVNGLLDYSSDDYGIVIGTLALGYLAFDPTNGLRLSGTVTANTINYSPHMMIGLFQVGISEISSSNNCMAMTTHGRYILIPGSGGTTTWYVWDSGSTYVYNYTRAASTTLTGLTIDPLVNCVVLSGTTEYILAFATGGTTCYRYNADGTSETACSFSGTAITTGAQRIGFSKDQGYVYIMDAATMAGTTIKRYTFAGTTLTYVDTVTLSAAPASAGTRNMYIGATYLIFGDALTNASRVTYQRYGRNSGTITTSKDWGHGTTGIGFVGNMIRSDDNGFLFCTEADTGSGTHSIIQRIYIE